MENTTSTSPQLIVEDVKNFYKQDFRTLLTTFFLNPIGGLMAVFQAPSEKSFVHSVIIFASTFVLYFVTGYLLAGDYREVLSFSIFLKIGITPVLFLFCVAALSYGLKMAFAGGADFRKELFTGAMCGIPILLMLLSLLLFAVFGNANGLAIISNPLAAGGLMLLVLAYLLFMLANVLQQSLRAAGIGEVAAWYLAPGGILLSLFVSAKIAEAVF